MLIISEAIATSENEVVEIIENRDGKSLLGLAFQQVRNGADMLAVSCAERLRTEPEDVQWILQSIQGEIEVPMCIDSSNTEAIQCALETYRGDRMMVNSTTAEQEKLVTILPLVKNHHALLTVLLHDEKGMPNTIEERLRVIPNVEHALTSNGIKAEDVYLDCLVFPLSIDSMNAINYFECLKEVKKRYPSFKTVCGVGNISHGLPEHSLIDLCFMAGCEFYGQDAVITDTTGSAALLPALHLIKGEDPDCLNYLQAFRAGNLK